MKEPLKKIRNNSGAIAKIQWCQRKAGKLAISTKNSDKLSIYSLVNLNFPIDENEQLNDDSTEKDFDRMNLNIFCVDILFCFFPRRLGFSISTSNLNDKRIDIKSFCWSNSQDTNVLVVDSLNNLRLINLVMLTKMVIY